MSTIIIGDTSPRVIYTGDGSTKSFSFGFPIFEEENIRVYFNDQEQLDGFEIIRTEETTGGTINFYKAPATNLTITIIRDLKIKRTTDFSESQAFRAKMLNYEFDYLVACLKQTTENFQRSISLPVYAENGISLELPVPESGKAIVWDTSEKKLTNASINVGELNNQLQKIQELTDELNSILEIKENLVNLVETTNQTKELAENNQASLENKLNYDINNISATGVKRIRSFFAINYEAGIDISYISQSIKYAAPSAGFVSVLAISSIGSATIEVMVNNTCVAYSKNSSGYTDNKSSVGFFVQEGDEIWLNYSSSLNIKKATFFPYKGDVE